MPIFILYIFFTKKVGKFCKCIYICTHKLFNMKEINEFRSRWRTWTAHGIDTPIWREISVSGENYTPLSLIIFHNGNINEDSIRYAIGKLYQGGFLERSDENRAFYRVNEKAVTGMLQICLAFGHPLRAQHILNMLCNSIGAKIYDYLNSNTKKSSALSGVYAALNADTEAKQGSVRQAVSKMQKAGIIKKQGKQITIEEDIESIIELIKAYINGTKKK